jgi:glycogen debranching enzyme
MPHHSFPVILLLLLTLSASFAVGSGLDSLGIVVRGGSREFAYTNKATVFYYGESNGTTRSSWQGFNVYGHEYLDDYQLVVDGSPLDRTTAVVTVYPDFLKRTYPNGIVEEFRVIDSLPLISVTVRSTKRTFDLEVLPLVADGFSLNEFVVGHRENALVLARKSHQLRSSTEDYPVWLGMSGAGFEANHDARNSGGRFAPFSLKFQNRKSYTVAFSVADTPKEADSLLQSYFRNADRLHTQRRHRMERLLDDTFVATGDRRIDKALAWAKLSLDALIMNQIKTGIFAGLPWFNNYWGRDTFISLPGATLVIGQHASAKAILRSFSEFQQIDSTSPDYGRIPNLVTTSSKAYNTADGTPRFVMMAKEYVIRSGDSSFMLEVYPSVIRSIEGTIKYHLDGNGFLTHKDAETWMDAVGPDGPWSPRGNRACDIQALWAGQLEAGIWFATELGDVRSAREWTEILSKLRAHFVSEFSSTSGLADHLNADGTKNTQIRPNQIFCGEMVGDSLRARILKNVVNELTYPYGVASLAQTDPSFHPYHQNEPFYPKDAAYHNGTVWTWVQGAVISELCHFGKQELAAQVTENSVHQILDRNAVGTQSELLDAIPRPGRLEPAASGTFSQAWNLAEFVRNFYDDYLGVTLDRYHHRLTIQPSLPARLGNVRARINMGSGRYFDVHVDRSSKSPTVSITTPQLKVGGTAVVMLPNSLGGTRVEFSLVSNSTMRVSMKNGNPTVVLGESVLPSTASSQRQPDFSSLSDLRFATPLSAPDSLPVCRGPAYPLLSHGDIKRENPAARVLVGLEDPEGDDVGSGMFTYPSHPFFKKGILDIRQLRITYDDSVAYFHLRMSALSNPGWHPEYGFQLTYVAIAIDQYGLAKSGMREVGHGSGYLLDTLSGFERLILVGGGIQVEDQSGRTLVGYIPTAPDIVNPLGNAITGEISFAIPLRYLGRPSPSWKFTVLAGAQDDHGGSGLGEFRTVTNTGGEWNGGGKSNPDDSNVYDVLITPAK